MEDEITFSPRMRKYWTEHSGLIRNIMEIIEETNTIDDDEFVRFSREDFSGISDGQWKLFKGLVEGDEYMFEYSTSGRLYINTRRHFTKKDFNSLLDYLLFDKPSTMKDRITEFIEEYRIVKPGIASSRQFPNPRTQARSRRRTARRQAKRLRQKTERRFLVKEREEEFKKRGMKIANENEPLYANLFTTEKHKTMKSKYRPSYRKRRNRTGKANRKEETNNEYENAELNEEEEEANNNNA
jgi:hypothetical protein